MARDITDNEILDFLEEITDYISRFPPQNLSFKKIIIKEQGHFEVLASGWIDHTRIHSPVVHIEYKDGKICIYYDGTDIDIQQRLIEKGVPISKFSLVHLPPGDLLLK